MVTGPRIDPPDAVLAVATRLLPPWRAGWGRAMRAELDAIEAARSRWGFALGCLAAVLAMPGTLVSLGVLLGWAGLLVIGATWACEIAYRPLRFECLALLIVIVIGLGMGRLRVAFGPGAATASQRAVRGGGQLAVGVFAIGLVAGYRFQPRADPTEQATTGLPILTATLLAYLVGFLATTAPRGRLGARPVALAGAVALGAVAVGFAPMAVQWVVPQSAGWTVLVVFASVAVTALWAARTAPAREAAAAGLLAGAAAGLLVPTLAFTLLEFVPVVVPDLSAPMPAAATAAERLQQSRSQAQDAFVAALLLGAAMAVVSAVATWRRPQPG
jgi:hypothetical protein